MPVRAATAQRTDRVAFDLDPQARVAEAHPVADRGAKHGDVRLARDRRVRGHLARAGLGRVGKAAAHEVRDDRVRARGVDDAAREAVPAGDDARAGDRAERDGLDVAGLEAHGGARGDVEAHAVRAPAVEAQRRVRLDEVVVRADLRGGQRARAAQTGARRTCTGRSPSLVTLSRMRCRPWLSVMASFFTMTAPGALSRANSDASTGGKASAAGTGRKEP